MDFPTVTWWSLLQPCIKLPFVVFTSTPFHTLPMRVRYSCSFYVIDIQWHVILISFANMPNFTYYFDRKVSDLILLQKPDWFQRSALAWGDLEHSYAYLKFSRLSIASVDNKQHLSEVVFRVVECRSAIKILTGKPTGKRLLGRPRRRWQDNIRIDLEEIGINAGNWVDSAQDRNYWRALVNAALNLRVP